MKQRSAKLFKFSDKAKVMRIASLFKEILQKYESLSRQNEPKDKT
jgi:hypothetical protein